LTETDALDFARASIGSVWALELLVLLGHANKQSWPVDDIVRELRGSGAAVEGALTVLTSAGLVAKTSDGQYRYQPASPALEAVGALVRQIYATKPTTLIAAIYEAPNEKLRTFARAFKFKE